MPRNTQISGFNVAARNYQALMEAVTNLGGGDDDLSRLHSDKALTRQVAELLVGKPATRPTSTVQIIHAVNLFVEHDRSVAVGYLAGRYDDDASPDITDANFPHQRVGRETGATIHLVKFPVIGKTTEREAALKAFGDPADMDDMLALGEQYPDIQRQDPTVFFGASWDHPTGSRRVGCLDGGAGSRYCNLYWANPADQWNPSYVFAVRARR